MIGNAEEERDKEKEILVGGKFLDKHAQTIKKYTLTLFQVCVLLTCLLEHEFVQGTSRTERSSRHKLCCLARKLF